MVVGGRDFYSPPRISPDGSRLCFLAWNLPWMPWDGCELHVADLAADGSVANVEHVAGEDGDESIWQPEWSPSEISSSRAIGAAGGTSSASTTESARRSTKPRQSSAIPRGRSERARTRSSVTAASSADTTPAASPTLPSSTRDRARSRPSTPTSTRGDRRTCADGNQRRHRRRSGNRADTGLCASTSTSGALEVLRKASSRSVSAAYFSTPRVIEFPTEGGLTAYAFFYPPTSPEFESPAGELPPLIVESHGGPTGNATATFSLGVQFWTSRGFAVVDVDYGGSTGYGRAYRERLNGQWGVVDLADCVNAARYLVDQGEADPDRLLITGGSAGGYTTICALTFTDAFAAGTTYFGIADLEQFAGGETHKFELQYEHTLVGPYPERADLYRERSPIHFTDRISTPMLVLQGSDDRVVPRRRPSSSSARSANAACRTRTSSTRARGMASEGGEHHRLARGGALVLRAGPRLRAGRSIPRLEVVNL